jgi:hypothetical protein
MFWKAARFSQIHHAIEVREIKDLEGGGLEVKYDIITADAALVDLHSVMCRCSICVHGLRVTGIECPINASDNEMAADGDTREEPCDAKLEVGIFDAHFSGLPKDVKDGDQNAELTNWKSEFSMPIFRDFQKEAMNHQMDSKLGKMVAGTMQIVPATSIQMKDRYDGQDNVLSQTEGKHLCTTGGEFAERNVVRTKRTSGSAQKCGAPKRKRAGSVAH